MTGPQACALPILELRDRLNEQRGGWADYFDFGYPAMAFREINRYTHERFTQHLSRRSQRRYRPPAGRSYYEHIIRLAW